MPSFARRSLLPLLFSFFASAVACSSSPSSDGPSSPTTSSDGTEPRAPDVGETPSESSGGPSTTPPTDEGHAPLFVGRFDTSDPAGPKASWPGTRVLARFEGTAVSVKLSEFAEPWMEGAPSYWEFSIDKGDWHPIEMIPDDQPHDFPLAAGLPPGEHVVELYKRSETQTGITQFLGFDFHDGRSLPPPERQKRRIEVMGDSSATGFGIEMLNAPNHDCPGADHGGRWQNFRKAWGAHLGAIFDAEVHAIAYSGKGVIQNIWPTDNDPLVAYYPRANPNPAIANSAPLFDLTSWLPDVIVLMQGAIDFSTGVDYGAFEAGYRDFVINQLRARNPDAHIFMGVLGKAGRSEVPQIAQRIIDERAKVGDTRLHVFVPPLYTWQDMVACNGHGTPDYHLRIAQQMAEHIGPIVGWE